MNNKVYEVYYFDEFAGVQTIGLFTTEDKAQQFIEDCKKVFYKEWGATTTEYDYRDYKLRINEWELDEWTDIIR